MTESVPTSHWSPFLASFSYDFLSILKSFHEKRKKIVCESFYNNNKYWHLSIVDEIDWEDEDPDCRVDEADNLHIDSDQGKDGDHQAKEDEDKEDAEEDPAAHCEINLGLKLFCFDT